MSRAPRALQISPVPDAPIPLDSHARIDAARARLRLCASKLRDAQADFDLAAETLAIECERALEPAETESLLLTIAEAATKLATSKREVYRLIAEGTLPRQ